MPQFRVCERELQANRRGNCQKKQKIRQHLFWVPKPSPQRQESEQQGIQTDKFSKNQQEEDRPTKDQPPCSPAVSMEEQGDQRQGDSRDAEMYRLSPKSGHSGFKQSSSRIGCIDQRRALSKLRRLVTVSGNNCSAGRICAALRSDARPINAKSARPSDRN